MAESRVKKTLLNARVNLIFYFLTLVLSFFSRKIFLDCLGAEFIGLTGTLQNLLGFLNLAELGIGSAIGYVLYKPLYDRDEKKICEIISVMGYLYRWIGLIILAGGCILACFLPLIFPDTGFSLSLIYFAYFSFLASSLIGYFINYRQNLLGADQRNYVVTGYYQTMNIFKTIIQMVLAYYTGSYYLWVAIELTFGIIYSFILNWKINKTYPWLRTELSQGRTLMQRYPLIIKNTKKIFLHKIGIVTQWQATPILIYAFESLQIVAFYENYTLFTSKLLGLLNSVLGSTEAAVGNLIAEGNNDKIEKVLWEMMSIRFWLSIFIVVGLYYLLPPFIVLWIGPEYVLPKIVLVLIILNIFIQTTQNCLGQFIYGFGLFNDVWATLTQAGIFLILAVILGNYFGLPGIVCSSVISVSLAFGVWKPYFLYHYGFKIPMWRYWKKWINVILVTCLTVAAVVLVEMSIAKYLPVPSDSYINLVIYSSILMLITLILSCIFMLSLNPYSRIIFKRFKRA